MKGIEGAHDDGAISDWMYSTAQLAELLQWFADSSWIAPEFMDVANRLLADWDDRDSQQMT